MRNCFFPSCKQPKISSAIHVAERECPFPSTVPAGSWFLSRLRRVRVLPALPPPPAPDMRASCQSRSLLQQSNVSYHQKHAKPPRPSEPDRGGIHILDVPARSSLRGQKFPSFNPILKRYSAFTTTGSTKAFLSRFGYNGNLSASSATPLRTFSRTLSDSGSFTIAPIKFAICPISASAIPRVVSAGVPNRIPDDTKGEFVSNGIVFLFTVIFAASSAFSATLPVMPLPPLKTSTRIRWLSVPPETSRIPFASKPEASALALSITFC